VPCDAKPLGSCLLSAAEGATKVSAERLRLSPPRGDVRGEDRGEGEADGGEPVGNETNGRGGQARVSVHSTRSKPNDAR